MLVFPLASSFMSVTNPAFPLFSNLLQSYLNCQIWWLQDTNVHASVAYCVLMTRLAEGKAYSAHHLLYKLITQL